MSCQDVKKPASTLDTPSDERDADGHPSDARNADGDGDDKDIADRSRFFSLEKNPTSLKRTVPPVQLGRQPSTSGKTHVESTKMMGFLKFSFLFQGLLFRLQLLVFQVFYLLSQLLEL